MVKPVCEHMCPPTLRCVCSQLDVKNALNLVSKILPVGDDRKEPGRADHVRLEVKTRWISEYIFTAPPFRSFFPAPAASSSSTRAPFLKKKKGERQDVWDFAVKALRKGKTSDCLRAYSLLTLISVIQDNSSRSAPTVQKKRCSVSRFGGSYIRCFCGGTGLTLHWNNTVT